MRSSLHRVDDELHIFGVNSKKIFRRFKKDIYVRSHEIWDLGFHQNSKKHREPAPSLAHQVNLFLF